MVANQTVFPREARNLLAVINFRQQNSKLIITKIPKSMAVALKVKSQGQLSPKPNRFYHNKYFYQVTPISDLQLVTYCADTHTQTHGQPGPKTILCFTTSLVCRIALDT